MGTFTSGVSQTLRLRACGKVRLEGERLHQSEIAIAPAAAFEGRSGELELSASLLPSWRPFLHI